MTTAPAMVMPVSGRSVAAASRIAAIGATRDALSAGKQRRDHRDQDADGERRDDRRHRAARARPSPSRRQADANALAPSAPSPMPTQEARTATRRGR